MPGSRLAKIQMARFGGEQWRLFGPLITGKAID
jgi:hypothetical protein